MTTGDDSPLGNVPHDNEFEKALIKHIYTSGLDDPRSVEDQVAQHVQELAVIAVLEQAGVDLPMIHEHRVRHGESSPLDDIAGALERELAEARIILGGVSDLVAAKKLNHLERQIACGEQALGFMRRISLLADTKAALDAYGESDVLGSKKQSQAAIIEDKNISPEDKPRWLAAADVLLPGEGLDLSDPHVLIDLHKEDARIAAVHRELALSQDIKKELGQVWDSITSTLNIRPHDGLPDACTWFMAIFSRQGNEAFYEAMDPLIKAKARSAGMTDEQCTILIGHLKAVNRRHRAA
ncbi:MAG: hypothetical protein WBP26_01010 [Candidatus Saccharimonadales bacterium]